MSNNETVRIIDFTPEPQMFVGMAQSRLGWTQALAELIDNSFDHRAQRVTLTFRAKSLLVQDDGEGVGNLENLLKPGRHVGSGETVGRYGWGFKAAATWIGQAVSIASLVRGVIRRAEVRWHNWHEFRDWKLESLEIEANPERCAQFDVAEPSGLTLYFSDIKQVRDFDRYRDDLSYLFLPALRQGRQILMNGGTARRSLAIKPWEFPELDESFTHTESVDGRGFSVTAGIIRAGASNPRPGFTIAYGHRVLQTTADPCGQYGCANFFAFVELGPEWKLSTHKDGLDEDEYEQLTAALASACQPLLEKASQRTQYLQLRELENALTQMTGRIVTAAGTSTTKQDGIKEKRSRGNQHGTVTPKLTNHQRRTTTQAQVGTRTLRTSAQARNGLRIDFSHLGTPRGPGEVQLGSERDSLLLNLDSRCIAQLQERNDRMGLALISLNLYAVALATGSEDQRQTRFPFRDNSGNVLRVYENLMREWTEQLAEQGVDRILIAV